MKDGKGKRRAPNWKKRAIVYRTWKNMLLRCYNPTHVSYAEYGGRGIGVWDKWNPTLVGDTKIAFEAFLHYVGFRPSQRHSIDRVRVEGNYEPGNIRWALPEMQGSNKRNTKMIMHHVTGEKVPAADLARELGLTYQQLRYRMMKEGTWNDPKPSDSSGSKAVGDPAVTGEVKPSELHGSQSESSEPDPA